MVTWPDQGRKEGPASSSAAKSEIHIMEQEAIVSFQSQNKSTVQALASEEMARLADMLVSDGTGRLHRAGRPPPDGGAGALLEECR